MSPVGVTARLGRGEAGINNPFKEQTRTVKLRPGK